MSKPNYALSIRQPWAWLIAAGHKQWENREWSKNYPALLFLKHHLIGQRIYIHASKGMTRDEYDQADDIAWDNSIKLPEFNALKRGGIIGEATIVGWRRSGRKQSVLVHFRHRAERRPRKRNHAGKGFRTLSASLSQFLSDMLQANLRKAERTPCSQNTRSTSRATPNHSAILRKSHELQTIPKRKQFLGLALRELRSMLERQSQRHYRKKQMRDRKCHFDRVRV